MENEVWEFFIKNFPLVGKFQKKNPKNPKIYMKFPQARKLPKVDNRHRKFKIKKISLARKFQRIPKKSEN